MADPVPRRRRGAQERHRDYVDGDPAALWLLLPLGSVYGLYIGFAQDVRRQGGCLPVVGIVANVLYLLFGLLTWTVVVAGVRV